MVVAALLLALAAPPSAPVPPPGSGARAQARASVAIVESVRVSSDDWNPAANPAQRERVRTGPDGRAETVRMTTLE